METSCTLTVPNRLQEIRTLSDFLTRNAERWDVPDDALRPLQLALEEIFTNIVHYAYDDDREHRIEIVLSKADQTVTVQVSDDGRPFDPLRDAPQTDFEAPVETRPVGGAGIALSRQMVSRMRYRRHDGRNQLTLIKELEPARP